jgi:hypothetical protein
MLWYLFGKWGKKLLVGYKVSLDIRKDKVVDF